MHFYLIIDFIINSEKKMVTHKSFKRVAQESTTSAVQNTAAEYADSYFFWLFCGIINSFNKAGKLTTYGCPHPTGLFIFESGHPEESFEERGWAVSTSGRSTKEILRFRNDTNKKTGDTNLLIVDGGTKFSSQAAPFVSLRADQKLLTDEDLQKVIAIVYEKAQSIINAPKATKSRRHKTPESTPK